MADGKKTKKSLDSWHYGITVKPSKDDSENVSEENKQKAAEKRKKFFLLAVLALILVAAGIIFYISRNKENNSVLSNDSPVSSDNQASSTEDELTKELKVVFLDVGQGDCILISCEGHHMLIDAGGEAYGTRVWKFLKDNGVETLDYCIGTHLDADHVGGMDVIVQKFDCAGIILPDYTRDTKAYRDLMDVIRWRRLVPVRPSVGDSYRLGSAEFVILAPSAGEHEDDNDYSIVILLKYGENSFLFTGDATETSETEMLALNGDLKADVLKAAHHGSSSSTGENFLEAVSPEYVVVSCGENNDYGHPHKSFLKRVKKAGSEILRTDEAGTITFVSDGETLTVMTEK